MSPLIIEQLSTIFNKSISEGVFPTKMKIAKVVPIFKSGDSHLFNNYRPISLLPVFSKIFEKLVHTRLYKYLLKYNILAPCQYGFKKNTSTTDALCEITGKILKSLDDNESVIAVFCDLSKAFDTISHPTLLKKL